MDIMLFEFGFGGTDFFDKFVFHVTWFKRIRNAGLLAQETQEGLDNINFTAKI